MRDRNECALVHRAMRFCREAVLACEMCMQILVFKTFFDYPYMHRGGSGGTVGGGIRSRESQRVFHTAASKLCEWAADIATCNQVGIPCPQDFLCRRTQNLLYLFGRL